jgi:hypothetical protein
LVRGDPVELFFQSGQTPHGLGIVSQIPESIGQGVSRSVHPEERQEQPDPGQVRALGGRGDFDGLIEYGQRLVRLALLFQHLPVGEKGPGESVFQVSSKLFCPVVPTPESGQEEVVQSRALPERPCLLHPALGEVPQEIMQVDLQHPFLQREGIVVLEEVFLECTSEDPECLAYRVSPLGSIGTGPEEVCEIIPGNGGGVTGYVDQKSERFSQREGDRIAVPIEDLWRAEDTE